MRVVGFTVAKQGNSEEENEDSQNIDGDPCIGPLRVAVADGATEALFSGFWAKLLTQAYATGQLTADSFTSSIAELSLVWEAHARGKQLPWYALEKLSYGGFAALVGVTIFPDDESIESRHWKSFAIGDSCLFQLRDGELITALPLNSPADFNNSPSLISSRADRNDELILSSDCGTWEPGDQFFLLSDALACWFLKERSESPGESKLSQVETEQDFSQLIQDLRKTSTDCGSALLKNDDSTMIRIIAG
jgi:hypothetical protein